MRIPHELLQLLRTLRAPIRGLDESEPQAGLTMDGLRLTDVRDPKPGAAVGLPPPHGRAVEWIHEQMKLDGASEDVPCAHAAREDEVPGGDLAPRKCSRSARS